MRSKLRKVLITQLMAIQEGTQVVGNHCRRNRVHCHYKRQLRRLGRVVAELSSGANTNVRIIQRYVEPEMEREMRPVFNLKSAKPNVPNAPFGVMRWG